MPADSTDVTTDGSWSWRTVDDDGLGAPVVGLLPAGRWSMLVDGRSAAASAARPRRSGGCFGADIVATDDVAWHLHPLDWAPSWSAG
ncbi:MAG: hypothetical protein ACRCYR_18625 [Phycicoccus sp.]